MCIGGITQTAIEMKLNKSQLKFDSNNAMNRIDTIQKLMEKKILL